MLNNFINPGLEDLALTRTSFNWGLGGDVLLDDSFKRSGLKKGSRVALFLWNDASASYGV